MKNKQQHDNLPDSAGEDLEEPAELAAAGDEIELTAAGGDSRLDVFLSAALSGFTRSRLLKVIRGGGVTVNGRAAAKASGKVRAGDAVRVVFPPLEPSDIEPEDIPLDILFEDKHLIVINKRKGLSVHPTTTCTSGTLVNALMFHCGDSLSGIGGELRPGIVHRLDKDTSGVMLVAKNDAAHAALAAQFNERTTEKHYYAIVHGEVKGQEGRIDAAIVRDPRDRKRMAVARREGDGRAAATVWRVESRFKWFVSVDLHLLTGRTHQARVHMAHLGHPIAGDPVYGGRKFNGGLKPDSPLRREVQQALERLTGQALHARSIEFTHPATGKRVRFEAPPPDDMRVFEEFILKYSFGV